ncbi:hypothetical protein [Kitasatospora purpeofusca]|uniref:Lipoprotein n=1 Tax=Kitasatospora purpeofusca TaxID=67352 RepID=A0ABZ1U7X0_9ACTN|nr:hypothetical protein [Kitasatospora purpeofusca]
MPLVVVTCTMMLVSQTSQMDAHIRIGPTGKTMLPLTAVNK